MCAERIGAWGGSLGTGIHQPTVLWWKAASRFSTFTSIRSSIDSILSAPSVEAVRSHSCGCSFFFSCHSSVAACIADTRRTMRGVDDADAWPPWVRESGVRTCLALTSSYLTRHCQPRNKNVRSMPLHDSVLGVTWNLLLRHKVTRP